MRERMDEESQKEKLNFTLIATPAEGLSGRFIKIDKKKYGVIEGVTDREYYTNSFHIPVYYKTSAFNKIKIEAPYHEYTNGGHISYVELDGKNKKRKENLLQPTRQRTFRYLPQLLFLHMVRVFIRQVFPVVIDIQLSCHTGFLLVQQ